MKSLRCVPLLSYMKVEKEETRFIGGWDDSVTKLWTLVSYQEVVAQPNRIPDPVNGGFMDNKEGPKTKLKTAEFCIKLQLQPDFCGGLAFMSPQVLRFGKDAGWAPTNGFCHPGDCETVDKSWETLEADPDRAIDLAQFTGKEMWTPGEIETYGQLCIAEACLAELLGRGTRGWVCSDALEGSMMRVHNHMVEMSGKMIPVGRALMIAGVLNKDYVGSKSMVKLWTRELEVTNIDTPEWYNGNSGNQVRMMMGLIKWDGSDDSDCERGGWEECPSCGEEHDHDCCEFCHNCEHRFDYSAAAGGDITYSGQVLRVLNNAAFAKQARRYDWSNG